MKRSKTIFALLLALTLLLGLTPVAFATEPNVTIGEAPEHTKIVGDPNITSVGDGTYTATFTWEAEGGYHMADPKVEIMRETGTPVENGEQATYAADTKTVTLTNLESDAAYKVILSTDFYTPINYYDDGVSDDPESNKPNDVMNLKKGETLTITDKIPTRAGYVFIGWKSDYDKKVYKAGDTLTVPGVDEVKIVNLVAQWADALEIEYKTDATDSVSGMPTPVKATVGAGNEFTTAAEPSRSGYRFLGWRASWNDELYKANAAVKAPDKLDSGTDLTLTAEWKKMSAIPGNPVGGGGSGGGSNSSQSYYYIYADCSSGGSVTPSGYTRVSADGSLTVSFAPKSGYSILAVYVDGVKAGTVGGQYTFSKVSADHKIYVQFEKTSEGYDDVPKTGDEAPLAAALGLAALSLAGLGCLLVSRRRAMR